MKKQRQRRYAGSPSTKRTGKKTKTGMSEQVAGMGSRIPIGHKERVYRPKRVRAIPAMEE